MNIKLFNFIEIRDESQTLKVIPDFKTVTKISNFKPFLQNIRKIVRWYQFIQPNDTFRANNQKEMKQKADTGG